MKELQASMLVLAIVVAVTAAGLFLPQPIHAGDLDQTAAPAPTMRTLDEIYNKVDEIPVPWTQILPAAERFEVVMGGEAVLDKETGLVWEQSPASATWSWFDACDQCYKRETGNRKGWRPPTAEELASLVDTVNTNPALPSNHPFTNVEHTYYWSTTTIRSTSTGAYQVDFASGSVSSFLKTSDVFPVWCVRGGQGYDSY